MKRKPKAHEESKEWKMILWEVNSFPAIEIKSGEDHEEDL